jgi:hypothetical protein
MSSYKDLVTPSNKLNEAPFRGKSGASLRQVNNDCKYNRVNKPPSRDPSNKVKCYINGSLDHLLNKCPRGKEYINKYPKKDRKPNTKSNLNGYISMATMFNTNQYMLPYLVIAHYRLFCGNQVTGGNMVILMRYQNLPESR